MNLRTAAADADIGSVIVPNGFDRGDLLAELARASLHLFRGDAGARGVQNADSGVTVWCYRDTVELRSMHAAFFPHERSDDPHGQLRTVGEIASRHRPDAVTIRVMSRTSMSKLRVSLKKGYLLFALEGDETRELLMFSGDFEAFVNSLGRRTSRNIRSSLRAYRKLGWDYVFAQPTRLAMSEEMRQLSARNNPAPLHAPKVEMHTRYINAEGRPYQSMLLAKDGSLISLIRGCLSGRYATVVDQMNASEFPKVGLGGLSLLHRALLIEELGKQDFRGLIFVGGCGEPLERSCRPIMYQRYLAVAVNPRSWLRCLNYSRINPRLSKWAVLRVLGSSKESP